MKYTTSILVMGLLLIGCFAGGGGSNYQVSNTVFPGGTISIIASVYEYGNNNVHKSIMPVTVRYRINNGEYVDVSAKLDIKTQENKTLYKIDIFTNAMNVKVGDTVFTEIKYKWHGKDESRSGLTRVVELK